MDFCVKNVLGADPIFWAKIEPHHKKFQVCEVKIISATVAGIP